MKIIKVMLCVGMLSAMSVNAGSAKLSNKTIVHSKSQVLATQQTINKVPQEYVAAALNVIGSMASFQGTPEDVISEFRKRFIANMHATTTTYKIGLAPDAEKVLEVFEDILRMCNSDGFLQILESYRICDKNSRRWDHIPNDGNRAYSYNTDKTDTFTYENDPHTNKVAKGVNKVNEAHAAHLLTSVPK